MIFTDDLSNLTTYSFKPQLKTVGPKYGKSLGGIKEYLANVDGNKAMTELEMEGALKFDVAGEAIELTKDDLLIEMQQQEGYQVASDNKITVALDINLTKELIEEGYVLEIISKIQTMRKDSGFEVMDHIKVYVTGSDELARVIGDNKDAISSKVLANEIILDSNIATAKDWNINGIDVQIGVEKI